MDVASTITRHRRPRRAVLTLLLLALVAWSVRSTACLDPCDEAVDYCLDCDLESSTCHQRFSSASDSACEAAVDEYQAQGCDPYHDDGACDGDTEPDPGPPDPAPQPLTATDSP